MGETKTSVKQVAAKAKTAVVGFFGNIAAKLKGLFAARSERSSQEKKGRSLSQKILSGVGIALCVLFGFMLVCNLAIIIKGYVAPEKPPSVFGITPMVVLSGSMSGDAPDHIETGDLVFISKADPEELKKGDIIAFMEGSTTVTHRIVRVETTTGGELRWITKGDANNAEDRNAVTEENLVGIYSFRIPYLGNLAMFLQQPVGMLIFIGVPCLAFILYDIIRRRRSAAKQSEKATELEAELERLRQLVDSTSAKIAAAGSGETAEIPAESESNGKEEADRTDEAETAAADENADAAAEDESAE